MEKYSLLIVSSIWIAWEAIALSWLTSGIILWAIHAAAALVAIYYFYQHFKLSRRTLVVIRNKKTGEIIDEFIC